MTETKGAVAQSSPASSPLRVMTPIIKVVGDHCNLRCAYCFYSACDQSIRRVMADEVLEQFTREYLALFRGRLSFIWHGGEPLLAGIPFFARAVELQRKYARPGHRIANHLQTNGTLIDRRWAGFFREHDFRIGISLDGDQDIHDRFRYDRAGQGTFWRVMRGIRTLREHDIRFGIVQVLTADSAPRVAETFDFFVNRLGLHQWSMNVFDAQDNPDMSGQTLSDAEYMAAVEAVTRLWVRQADRTLVIREIEALVQGAMGKRSAYCSFAGDCDRYFCLNWDGAIYPCDSYTNNPATAFGRLEDGLEPVLRGEPRNAWLRRVSALHPGCLGCRWHQMCHNGCPQHRTGGPEGKYVYCGTRREMFARMERLVQGIQRDRVDEGGTHGAIC